MFIAYEDEDFHGHETSNDLYSISHHLSSNIRALIDVYICIACNCIISVQPHDMS